MRQLDLFAPPPAPRRPPDLAFIRKRLGYALSLARKAERLPWSEVETESWEERFPKLAAYLPAEEGAPMAEAFRAEIKRLRGGTP